MKTSKKPKEIPDPYNFVLKKEGGQKVWIRCPNHWIALHKKGIDITKTYIPMYTAEEAVALGWVTTSHKWFKESGKSRSSICPKCAKKLRKVLENEKLLADARQRRLFGMDKTDEG